MLQSIKEAHSHKARKNVAIARDLERAAITVTQWFHGWMYVPTKVRRALDTAIGHPVDWEAYEAEFAATHDARFAAKAAAAPRPAPPAVAPPPPAPPERPATPLKIAATPPRRVSAPVPAPKPPQARPAPAPTAPAPVSGFMARLFAPSSQDLFE